MNPGKYDQDLYKMVFDAIGSISKANTDWWLPLSGRAEATEAVLDVLMEANAVKSKPAGDIVTTAAANGHDLRLKAMRMYAGEYVCMRCFHVAFDMKTHFDGPAVYEKCEPLVDDEQKEAADELSRLGQEVGD